MFKRFWWIMLVLLPVGMFCGVLLAAGASYLMPKTYESHSVLEIVHPLPARTRNLQWPLFEGIKSRRTLKLVADDLTLTTRWGMDLEACLERLDEAISVDLIRGTDLFTVSVRDRNPEDARDLATAITRRYVALWEPDRSGTPNINTPPAVVVHSAPELPTKPVSPNVLLNLFIGSAAGMVLALVMALPIMALLHRRSKPTPVPPTPAA